MALIVPIPKLEQDGADGPIFVPEKRIMLSCDAARLADGSIMPPDRLSKFGYLLYRQNAGMNEVWDEANQEWKGESGSIEPVVLAYQDNIWKTVLIAIGQKDKYGNKKFLSDPSTGYPKYFVRCFFAGTDSSGADHQGTSPASTPVQVLAEGAQNRAGLIIEPKAAPPREAEKIRLFLKDKALSQEKATIEIREQGVGYQIVLTNGAVVSLTGNGDIELTPLTGKQVIVNGNLAVTGSMSVQGSVSTSGAAMMSGGLTVQNGLSVSGNVSIWMGTLSVDGAIIA